MTVFAGIFARHASRILQQEEIDDLASRVSRFAGDSVIRFVGQRAAFFKIDIGALTSAGHYFDDSGNACMVAGEPLVGDVQPSGRLADVRRIASDIQCGSVEALRDATGTFCGCHYDARDNRVTLFNDRSGVRPIYYAVLSDVVVFSSALRIIEGWDLVPKHFDLQGVAEIACFGFALGERTAYENVRCLPAGHTLAATGQAIRHDPYFRWDCLAPVAMTQDASKTGWTLFVDGVRRRLGHERVTLSFLSGGLDSRAIVGALVASGAEVGSLNFAPPDTQDEVFASMLAKAVGVRHSHVAPEVDHVTDSHRVALVRRWISSLQSVETLRDARDKIMWSGDGGSVGVGHVYLTEELITIARTEGDAAAVDAFFRLNNLGLPGRLFNRAKASEIVDLPKQGMLGELAKIGCEDRGKALYVFLMMNDQRRHLEKHFESIDLDRIEFQLPFFDGLFLEYLMKLPIDPQLEHRFYMQWIGESPLRLASIPWQAYPGHVQCPHPIPEGLNYQWGAAYYDYKVGMAIRKQTAQTAYRLALMFPFPHTMLGRIKILYLGLATRFFRERNYAYAIKAAGVFVKYWGQTRSRRG